MCPNCHNLFLPGAHAARACPADAVALIRFTGVWGREVGRTAGPVATLQVTDRAGTCVRAECYGCGLDRAWTQPV